MLNTILYVFSISEVAPTLKSGQETTYMYIPYMPYIPYRAYDYVIVLDHSVTFEPLD